MKAGPDRAAEIGPALKGKPDQYKTPDGGDWESSFLPFLKRAWLCLVLITLFSNFY